MSAVVQPGDRIAGKYVVERFLGQGGMGAVFVARQEQLDRLVAIKFLLSEAAENSDALARFEREARSAAALQSDHATRVFDVGHLESGEPYMVMELLCGEDLAKTLERCGPLPPAEVTAIVVQACDAIGEAHAIGIVHRDLKPANIFLAQRPNGTMTVKVLDFGISKVRGPAAAKSLTSSKSLIGSPTYMSPEQLREARTVDGRADIWALGVTMYQLLTGVLPFCADTVAELCALVLTVEPASLRSRRPEVPDALEAVVMRCLRKNPAERYAAAGELVGALKAVRLPVAAVATSAVLTQTLVSPSPPAGSDASSQPSASVATGSVVSSTLHQRAVRATGRRASVLVVAASTIIVAAIATWRVQAYRVQGHSLEWAGPVATRVVLDPAASVAMPAVSIIESDQTTTATALPIPTVPSPAASVVAARPVVRSSVVAPPSAKPANCKPPFYYDADHNRVFKKECL
jgi:serine/threonine-protein kinase